MAGVERDVQAGVVRPDIQVTTYDWERKREVGGHGNRCMAVQSVFGILTMVALALMCSHMAPGFPALSFGVGSRPVVAAPPATPLTEKTGDGMTAKRMESWWQFTVNRIVENGTLVEIRISMDCSPPRRIWMKTALNQMAPTTGLASLLRLAVETNDQTSFKIMPTALAFQTMCDEPNGQVTIEALFTVADTIIVTSVYIDLIDLIHP